MGECIFWLRPNQVVPDKGSLNSCVCVCVTLALLYTKNTEIPGRDVDWVDAIVESGKLGHIW